MFRGYCVETTVTQRHMAATRSCQQAVKIKLIAAAWLNFPLLFTLSGQWWLLAARPVSLLLQGVAPLCELYYRRVL